MKGISIFDLDRTITRHGTWSPFLLYAARTRAPWRLGFVPFLIAAMAAHKLGLLNRKRLKSVMHSAMLGRAVSRAEVITLAEAFAQRAVAGNVYPGAIALIRAEQAAGRRVMIATAANHFYLDAIATRLCVEDVIGTRSVWHGEQLKAAISGDNCYGIAKRDMTAEYFLKHQIDRGQCNVRFYSDDMSDLPSFEWADECFAVNPSRKLAWHAMRQGWPIIDWRQKALRNTATNLVSPRLDESPINPASRTA